MSSQIRALKENVRTMKNQLDTSVKQCQVQSNDHIKKLGTEKEKLNDLHLHLRLISISRRSDHNVDLITNQEKIKVVVDNAVTPGQYTFTTYEMQHQSKYSGRLVHVYVHV